MLNKYTHIMYTEMENVIKKREYISASVNYAKNAHACTHAHTHTHTLYRLMGVKDNVV